jgi:hypothetical protein
MKYIELVESIDKQRIEWLLDNYFSLGVPNSVKIADNGLVTLMVSNCKLDYPGKIARLPIKFKIITGNFECDDGGLTTLSGVPTIVGGYFKCGHNNLKSLIGGPHSVSGFYNCNNNPLISLEGFPEELDGMFYCDWAHNLPLLRTLKAKHGVRIERPNTGDIHPITTIINKFKAHTNLRHAILDCQRALIEAGFSGNARW